MTKVLGGLLASLFLSFTLLLGVVFVILVFFVPYLMLLWEEQDQELAGYQVLLANLSVAAQNHGWLLGGLLAVLLLIAVLVRLVVLLLPARKPR